jgi:chromatin assembly factor 1 subunit A
MELDSKDQTRAAEDARDILRQIPMKTLKFGEDVRPPYQGTFSRSVPEVSARKLARNPYYRGLPEVNYDYDSEAEWEEPEEGEDLDSEEDEEGSDDGDDDMDGFLDDEDDALLAGRRRLIVGDLEPVSSGLCWAADGVDPDMKAYQAETISDTVKFPIDPFSTAYWEKPKPAEPAPTQTRIAPPSMNTLDVFRVNTPSGAPAVGPAKPPATGKPKRPFPPEQLGQFRQVVESSDLSKIGTVEILKKKYVVVPPKCSLSMLLLTLHLGSRKSPRILSRLL